jgi:alanyl-tRNA synthetase
VLEKLSALQSDMKEKAKQIEALTDKIQMFESQNLFNNKIDIRDGLTLTFAKVNDGEPNNMRKLGDIFVDKMPKGVLFLFTIIDDKVSFILKTSRNNKMINCSEILKQVMPIVNGRGGGKPDNAQGSGDAAKTEELLKAVEGALK